MSNVNVAYILRLLSSEMDCVPSVGYGNIWGQLLDPNSSLNNANPDIIVLLTDIEQLIDGCFENV